jgi:type IV secretion system protein VirB6
MDVFSVLGLIDALQHSDGGGLGLHGADFGSRAGGGVLGNATNLYFFYEIKEFINARVDRFASGLLGRMMTIASGGALALMTLWVFWQGIRIMIGKSQESMMGLVMSSARAVFILALATTMATTTTPLLKVLADGTNKKIYQFVTGKNTGDPYSAIDKSLSYMQLAMISIDALDVSGDENIESAKSRAQLFTGIGIAGPSLVGGTLLLLNRIAMALFIGFGPLFLVFLLFEPTKHLFSKWLLYGIGTMFSFALLSVMVSIALDVVTAVAAAFWVGSFLGSGGEGISSMALQQGGLGTILTLLIITVPPMAASFFQGTLGQLSTVNMFGGGAASAAQTQQNSQQSSTQSSQTQTPPPRNSSEADRGSAQAAPPPALNNPAAGPRTSSPLTSDQVKTERGRELTDAPSSPSNQALASKSNTVPQPSSVSPAESHRRGDA